MQHLGLNTLVTRSKDMMIKNLAIASLTSGGLRLESSCEGKDVLYPARDRPDFAWLCRHSTALAHGQSYIMPTRSSGRGSLRIFPFHAGTRNVNERVTVRCEQTSTCYLQAQEPAGIEPLAATDELEGAACLDEQAGRVELTRVIEMTAATTRKCSQLFGGVTKEPVHWISDSTSQDVTMR